LVVARFWSLVAGWGGQPRLRTAVPIAYRIDHEKKIVLARGYGVFSPGDVFDYQRTAWSDPGVAGYNELIDMTHVAEVSLPSAQRIQELASVAARMDVANVPSRLAIVAPTDLAFGLGRMFKVYREADERGTKEVGVFRTLDEALLFLGLKQPPDFPPLPPGFVPQKA
jgi:hypothetical protein